VIPPGPHGPWRPSIPAIVLVVTKARVRTGCRTLAVLLAAWSALLALDGATVGSNFPYECSAPISYVLPDSVRYFIFDPGDGPDWVHGASRSRAIGAGVTIGLFGNIVALLLGFTRPPAQPVEPLPPSPPVKPTWPIRSPEDEADEEGLWNPGRRLDRLREPPRTGDEPPD
jgi:hypothetical protein